MKSESSYSDEAKKAIIKVLLLRKPQMKLNSKDTNDPEKRKKLIGMISEQFNGMTSEQIVNSAKELYRINGRSYDNVDVDKYI